MKKGFLSAALIATVLGVVSLPVMADTHVGVGVSIGGGGGYYGGHGYYGRGYSPGYYHGYYPGYYSGWGYPAYYYAPPPVVYTAPAPTVIYSYPEPQTTYVVPSAMPANQTSETYLDQQGRTCRQFQSQTSASGSLNGTACLQPDGTWRVVP